MAETPPHHICAGFSMLSSPDGSKPAPLVVCMSEGQSWPCKAGVFECWNTDGKTPPPAELTVFQGWLKGQTPGSAPPPTDYEFTTYATSQNNLGVYFNRQSMSEANLTWAALQYMSTSFPLFKAAWWA